MLGQKLQQTVKAIAVMHNAEFVLMLLRGDHALNEIKASKLPGLNPFRFATDAEIREHMGCAAGYLGPVSIKSSVRLIVDRSVALMSDFTCGANDEGYHLTGVNWGRDLPEPALVADIRNVIDGDPSPDGKGSLSLCRGIEVGHIFQLRTKYSQAMNCNFIDEAGQSQAMEMGCYGIGVTRIVGAAIEQGHDERGIVLPASIAPFSVAIVPMAYHKSEAVRAAADALYAELREAGLDVLLEDRNERPGVLFADMELIGVPHRIVVGERGLANNEIEYKGRRDEAARMVARNDAFALLRAEGCTA